MDPDGEQLTGNVSGALRIGDTLRRPTGPWTPAVHALLRHLAARIPHVPRVHGIDDRGREILDYLGLHPPRAVALLPRAGADPHRAQRHRALQRLLRR